MSAGAQPEDCDDAASRPPLGRWLPHKVETAYQTRFFHLEARHSRHERLDKEDVFYVVNVRDWVVAVAVTPQDEIVLVRQFRHGVADFTWELPAGLLDEGEEPIEGALRELREESGFAGSNARLIGTPHPNPALQGNRCHVVLVENAEQVEETCWDPNEELEEISLPVEEALQWAREGKITHSIALSAFFLFEPWWRERRG